MGRPGRQDWKVLFYISYLINLCSKNYNSFSRGLARDLESQKSQKFSRAPRSGAAALVLHKHHLHRIKNPKTYNFCVSPQPVFKGPWWIPWNTGICLSECHPRTEVAGFRHLGDWPVLGARESHGNLPEARGPRPSAEGRGRRRVKRCLAHLWADRISVNCVLYKVKVHTIFS